MSGGRDANGEMREMEERERTNEEVVKDLIQAAEGRVPLGTAQEVIERNIAFNAARAAVLSRMSPGWQDISTAPRDGTLILTAIAGGGVTSSSCFRGHWGGWMMFVTPTHWMPLPSPPASPTPESGVAQPDGERGC